MRRLALLGIALLAVSACDPAHNPIMAVGKDIGTAGVPLQEYQVYFKEPVPQVYDAVLVAGRRNGLTLVNEDVKARLVFMSYDFDMIKNVWGGRFRAAIDSVGGRTRLTAHFYEKSKYVVNSILNPFVEDVKTVLSPAGQPSGK